MLPLEGPWQVDRPGTGPGPAVVWVPRDPPSPPGTPPPPVVVYRRVVEVPADLGGAAALLELAGVLGRVRVRINGDEYEPPAPGQVATALDVSRSLRPGTNRLEIEVAGPAADAAEGRRRRHPLGWGEAGRVGREPPRGAQAVAWGAWARPEAVPPGHLPPGLAGPVRLRFVRGVAPVGLSWFIVGEGLEPFPAPGGAAGRRARADAGSGQLRLPMVRGCARVRYVATEPARGRCWVAIEPDGFAAPGACVAWDVEAVPPGGTWEIGFTLPAPRLWTLGEWGRPHVYRLRAWFEPQGEPQDSAGATPGTTPMVGPPDEPGSWPPGLQPAPAPAALVGVRFCQRVDGAWYLNGRPLRFRGACLVPSGPWPGAITARQARAWVRRARALGLNALRVYAHAAHPALYEAATRWGIAIWQDLPPVGSPSRDAAAALEHQLAAWVEEVGRWPAVIAWSLGAEPAMPAGAGSAGLGMPPGRGRAPEPAQGASPGPSQGPAAGPAPGEPVSGRPHGGPIPRTSLAGLGEALKGRPPLPWRWPIPGDRAVAGLARELERLDPSRPVLERVGSPSWTRAGGTWRYFPAGHDPEGRHLARRLAWMPHVTVVSSLGWPAADHTGQAQFVRYSTEVLRRRPHPAGGGFLFALNDPPGGPAYGLYTAEGRPRAAARACREACAPVRLLLGTRPGRCRPGRAFRLPVWLVNDRDEPVSGRWTWRLLAGGQVLQADTLACAAGPLDLVPVGWVTARWPQEAVALPPTTGGAEPGPLAGGAGSTAEDGPTGSAGPAAGAALRLVLELQAGGRVVRVEYPLPGWLPARQGAEGPGNQGGAAAATGREVEPGGGRDARPGERSPRAPAGRLDGGNPVRLRFV
ncbi:hypothetical protein [Thermaerobacter litoralis]